MIQLLHDVTKALLHFFDVHQLPTLFLLLLIEEAGIPIPIPGDTLILLAGVQTHTKLLRESILVVLVTCSSTILGASLLFAVMRQGGRPFLLKYGRYIRISPAQVEKVERWLVRRGRIAIVLGRLIPGLRIITTVVAGLGDMPYREFLIGTSIAAVIWSLAYFWIGVLFGHNAPLFISYVTGLIDYVPKWLLVLTVFFLVFTSIGGGIAWTSRWQQRRALKRAARSAAASTQPSHDNDPLDADGLRNTGAPTHDYDAHTLESDPDALAAHESHNTHDTHATLAPLNPYDEYDVRIRRSVHETRSRPNSTDSVVSSSPSQDGSRRPM